MDPAYQELIKAAEKAMENACCPYSHFKVGAAVLTARGMVYTGANVENASYGLSNCAERTAVFKAVTDGDREIKAVAVVASGKGLCAPCGACRQVIFEFGKDADVVFRGHDGEFMVKKIQELLPCSFGPENLQR